MRGRYFRFFFYSTAKTLVIYREFWYFFRIFPTLFSQLISIFMSLLHTFYKGVKIDARLPRSERFASIMRSGVLLRPPVSAGVLEPLKKIVEIVVVLLPTKNVFSPNRWTQYISWLLIHYLHHHLMVTGAESDSYWLHHLLLQH